MMREEQLRALLEAHNISLEKWGTGQAKTFDHLLKEINDREIRLVADGHRLLRLADGGTVNVYYDDGDATRYLREDRQVFTDGRVRMRKDLLSSIGEKMRVDETPLEAAYRALREELGISDPLPLIPWKEPVIKGPIPSPSFPGLYTIYTMHGFDVYLPRQHYKPEGYVEVQKDKSSYFVWVITDKAPR